MKKTVVPAVLLLFFISLTDLTLKVIEIKQSTTVQEKYR
jgi:hypothetical protein